MNAQEIKDILTTEQVIQIMEYLGADVGTETEEYITFTSLCHNSDSHKLYYYPNTHSWYCFVCSNVDVFTVIQQEMNLTFQESLKFVEDFFNLNNEKRGFGRELYTQPKREIIKKPIDINEQLPCYDESILNTFKEYHAVEWEQEGISSDVMKQFEIKFCINTKSIIIPCRDINNRLVRNKM